MHRGKWADCTTAVPVWTGRCNGEYAVLTNYGKLLIANRMLNPLGAGPSWALSCGLYVNKVYWTENTSYVNLIEASFPNYGNYPVLFPGPAGITPADQVVISSWTVNFFNSGPNVEKVQGWFVYYDNDKGNMVAGAAFDPYALVPTRVPGAPLTYFLLTFEGIVNQLP